MVNKKLCNYGKWATVFVSMLFSFCYTLVAEFKLGIENISDALLAELKGKRIGLITNHTGIDQTGRRSVDLFLQKGLKISYLFTTEHGIDGKLGAGGTVENSVDDKTNIPIVSVYDSSYKKISADIMNLVDLLMFDMQDSGMRHYTYISTLLYTMRTAAEYKKLFVVYDRPNPLGVKMEGPLVDAHLRSFISVAAIPLRHSMTIGELAQYFNVHELENPVKLRVVTMQDYDRRKGVGDKLPVPFSSGLKTLQSCYGYSFVGLLGEIQPFAIGLRTAHSFRCIMLPEDINFPKEKWWQLRSLLQKYGINSVAHEYTHPNNKKVFKGLLLKIADINRVESFNAFLATIDFFKRAGVQMSFAKTFDLAVGTSKVQELVSGYRSHNALKQEVNARLQLFAQKAQSFMLYKPLPVIVLMR